MPRHLKVSAGSNCEFRVCGIRLGLKISRFPIKNSRLCRTSGETEMKKVFMLVLAMCVMFTISAMAQGSMGSDTSKKKKSAKSSTAAKGDMGAETSVAGTITTNKAGKPALKADSDGKTWTIVNPEAVKGHEGHHVTVSGHPDAKKMTIHVMKVDMMSDGMKGDNMGSDTGKGKAKAKGKKKKAPSTDTTPK